MEAQREGEKKYSLLPINERCLATEKWGERGQHFVS